MKKNPTACGVPLFAQALAATLLLAGAAAAHAEWPERAVRIVVPYGPGGAVDVATRKMAQKLGEQTGQSFIVENKPGATGTIGASQVARSAADGYTLMANDTTYSLLPFIFKKLPFDHGADLQPVSAFIFAPMALVVKSDGPYKTLDDLVARAKAAPSTVTYGSGGPGTTPHFAAEGLGQATGVKFMHVPFKGAAEATQAVLGNVVDFQFASTTGVMGAVKGGSLRLLAISGNQRLPVLKDVPTFAEAGVKDFGVVNWTGLWAPKGTPPEVLARLQKEVATAMNAPDMKEFAQSMGADPRQVDSAGFARILRDSSAMWKSVSEKTGFEAR
ncbi:lipoprotein [Bordetella ansorpii]|uniref:Lipoprotein n=1 Tax=Bordetella ansorpii TaxID=288768 RepID=A0A157P4N4_9BORD|nr:tripartite tricarboxylate transporter substrate binding protein [Bordetella ansorpii]SAI28401.1 lipoprotein [Bordetella ansorpii]